MLWAQKPDFFHLVLAICFLVLSLLLLRRNYIISRRLKTTGRSTWVKFLLRSATFSLLLIALLGPSAGQTTEEVKAIGKDIYLCVDISASMLTQDVPPSRLDRVKVALKAMAEAFATDRLGLIIFTDQAFVQCPLTTDIDALFTYIETLSPALIASGSTNFAAPLQLAEDKILASDDGAGTKNKIVLLVADGEDFGPDNAENIASEMASKGIKLFTLGVGTADGGNIPDGQSGFMQDANGENAVSKLSSKILKALAEAGGGQYFEINNQSSGLSALVASVSAIEGTVREVKKVDITTNRFYYFLSAAILLIVFDVLFTIRIIRL